MYDENLYSSLNVANMIKDQAKIKNIVIKDMLSELHLGQNTISNLRHGKMISAGSLALIADYLDCSVDYLLGRETKKEAVPDSSHSAEEEQLLTYFRKLNSNGREKALVDIADLTEIEKYINHFYTVKRVAREGTVEYVTVTDDDIEGYSKLETPSDEV